MTDPNSQTRGARKSGPRAPIGKDEVTPNLIAGALTGGGGGDDDPPVPLSAAKTISEAAEMVVREKLDLEMFITEQWEKIDKKLVECDEYATAAAFGGDMIFISMAIPLVNGVIHVGSPRERLQSTTDYIAEEWQRVDMSDPDRIPVISALTLIYLITKGWNKANKEYNAVNRALMRLEQQGEGASKGSKGQSGKSKKAGGAAAKPADESLKNLREELEEKKKPLANWNNMMKRVRRLCRARAGVKGLKSKPG